MEKKKIVRKVISKVSVAEAEEVDQADGETQRVVKQKRGCYFCLNNAIPSYTDLNVLRRYLTDRAKILPRSKSNLCARHQRVVSKNIKYARHLALLPFIPKV